MSDVERRLRALELAYNESAEPGFSDEWLRVLAGRASVHDFNTVNSGYISSMALSLEINANERYRIRVHNDWEPGTIGGPIRGYLALPLSDEERDLERTRLKDGLRWNFIDGIADYYRAELWLINIEAHNSAEFHACADHLSYPPTESPPPQHLALLRASHESPDLNTKRRANLTLAALDAARAQIQSWGGPLATPTS